jgi:hypothetical protein
MMPQRDQAIGLRIIGSEAPIGQVERRDDQAIETTLDVGAVMAIEDSAVLARCIESSVDAAAALDLYQRNRAERTARIVNESTEHGELYHIVDAAEMKRAFAEKNIAKSRNEWLYCYDPLNVPLT